MNILSAFGHAVIVHRLIPVYAWASLVFLKSLSDFPQPSALSLFLSLSNAFVSYSVDEHAVKSIFS